MSLLSLLAAVAVTNLPPPYYSFDMTKNIWLTAAASSFVSKRREPAKRCFASASVEATIAKVQAKLGDTKMAWLFANCFPNTLDTTDASFVFVK